MSEPSTRLGVLEKARRNVSTRIAALLAEVEALHQLDDDLHREVVAEQDTQRRLKALGETTRAALTTPEPGSPELTIHVVADMLDVEVADIVGTSRYRNVGHARMVAMWLIRQQGFSYPAVGRVFNRDHTTAMYAVRRVEETPDLLAVASAARQAIDVENLIRRPALEVV